MNIDYKQIGKRIKAVRNSKRMTQEQLAESLGVSVGYVSQVERGKTKISLDLLASVAGSLSCEIAYLIDGTNTFQCNYLENEMHDVFTKLSSERKKILLKIAMCLSEE